MSFLDKLKKVFVPKVNTGGKVNVKKYVNKAKKQPKPKSKRKVAPVRQSESVGDRANHSTADSPVSHTSRKGKVNTATKAVAKNYAKVGETKAKEQKAYQKWKTVTLPKLEQQTKNSNLISVKRGRSQYVKNDLAPTTGRSEKTGKQEAYKNEQDYYKQNQKTAEVEATKVKGEYEHGNRALRGAKDRLLENLGMDDKATQAEQRLGKKVASSTEVKKAKESKEYEAGQFLGDVASFAIPGAAEGTVAKGILKGGSKAVKLAKAGARGGKTAVKSEVSLAEKGLKKLAEKGARSKAISKTTKAVRKPLKQAKNSLKTNAKAKEFVANRAADSLTALPMNVSASAADAKKEVTQTKGDYGKAFAKNLALNVGADIAMGGAVEGVRAGRSVKNNKVAAKGALKQADRLKAAEVKPEVKAENPVNNKVAAKAAIKEAEKLKYVPESESGKYFSIRKQQAEGKKLSQAQKDYLAKFDNEAIDKARYNAKARKAAQTKADDETARAYGDQSHMSAEEERFIEETNKMTDKEKAEAHNPVRTAEVPEGTKTGIIKTRKGVKDVIDRTFNGTDKTLREATVNKVDTAAKMIRNGDPTSAEALIREHADELVETHPHNTFEDSERALDFKKYLRDTKISIPENHKFADWADYKKNAKGVNIVEEKTTGGANIDDEYNRLKDLFPEIIKGRATNEADMLEEIVQARRNIDGETKTLEYEIGEDGVAEVKQQTADELLAMANKRASEMNFKKEPITSGQASRPVTEQKINTDARAQEKGNAWEGLKNLAKKAQRAVVDDYAPIEDIARKMNDKEAAENLLGEVNAVRQAKERAKYNYATKQTDFNGNEIGDSVADILIPAKRKGAEYWNDVQKYAYNKHNIARNKNGTDVFNGDNLGKSQDIVKELEAKYKDDPEFLETHQKIVQYGKNVIDMLADSGRITKETAEDLKAKYPDYVPTFRDLGDDAVQTSKKSQHIDIDGIKQATGSEKALLSLDEQLIGYTNRMWKEAQNTKLMNKLVEASGMTKAQIGGNTLDDVLDGSIMDVTPNGESYRVSYFENGEKVSVDVDKELGEAINEMVNAKPLVSKDVDAILSKTTGFWNNFLKRATTGSNPIFAVKNGIRDGFTAAFNTKYGVANFVKAYPRAIKEILTDGEYFKKWKASGGAASNITHIDRGISAKETPKPLQWAKAPLRAVETMNEIVESIPRMQEFICSMDKQLNGKKISEATNTMLNRASRDGAEVTTNFLRSGKYGKFLNRQFVPFLNPGIQGVSREVRLIGEALQAKNGKQIAKNFATLAMRAGAIGIAPAVVNEMLYDKDSVLYKAVYGDDKTTAEEYASIHENTRLTSFCMKINGVWVRIPKSRILSVLSMGGSAAANSDNYSLKQMGKTAIDQAAPANPIENNIFAPVMQAAKNESWFGQEIDPEEKDMTPAEEHYDASTSAYAKKIGQVTGISPKKIDYVTDQYTGVIADFAHPMTAKAASKHGRLASPVIDQFTVDVVGKNNIQSKFYEKLSETKGKANSVKATKKDKANYERMQSYSYRAANINSAIKEVQNSDADDKDKIRKVEKLQKMRNRVLAAANNGKELSNGYEAKDFDNIRDVMGDKYMIEKQLNYESKYGKPKVYTVAKQTKDYKHTLDVYSEKLALGDSSDATNIALAKTGADSKQIKAWGGSEDSVKEIRKTAQKLGGYDKLIRVNNAISKAADKIGSSGTMSKYIGLANAKASDDVMKAYTKVQTNPRYKAQSDAYYGGKINAARNLKNEGIKLNQIKSAKEDLRKQNGGGNINSEQAQAYIEKHYKGKSDSYKATMWESLCTNYFDGGKNPYGEVKARPIKSGTKKPVYNGKKVEEISKDYPTTIKPKTQYQKKYNNTEANKAWLSDKLAVVNKAKAISRATTKASKEKALKEFVKEADKQNSKNGMTRHARSYFEPEKKETGAKTSGKGYSKGYGRSYGRSGGKGYGRSGGGRGSGGGSVSVPTREDIKLGTTSITVRPKAKGTKDYGLTKAEVRAIEKELQNAYGVRAASAYMQALSTRVTR